MCDDEWLPRRVNVQPVPQPHPDPKPRPRIWLGSKILKNKAAKPEPILGEDYCAICTPFGKIGTCK